MGDRQNNRGFTPKLNFPRYNGANPCILKARCHDYFAIMDTPESMWATVVALHMDDNAEKWLHMYK
jgi:hypothetical protein